MADALTVEEMQSLLPFDDSPLPASSSVREQIGGTKRRIEVRQIRSFWKNWTDISQSDYAFYDKLRRGQARGYELSGLLWKSISDKIASWTLGRLPLWVTRNESMSQNLNDWWRKWQPSILRAYRESLDLGDCYLVMNGDSSLTIVPPDAVTPLVAEDDPGRWLGWKITTTVPHPTEAGKYITYEDQYTATSRKHLVKHGETIINGNGKGEIFINPMGRLPVIHIANRKGADERFGRPEGEGLVNLLLRYGDVIDAALKGNIRQGRPTPVIEGMGSTLQVNDFWDRYGHEETRTNPNTGETETVTVIDFDPDQLLTLGGDSSFKYAAPAPFTPDTLNLLQILFYLFVQHTGLPEYILGAAIGSSKASADSQTEPFEKFILMKRGEAQSWIDQLAGLYLAWVGTYNRRARNLEPIALWKPMVSGDGRLTLDSVIYAYAKGMLDREMALWLMPLNISDSKILLDRADKELKLRGSADGITTDNASQNGEAPASGGGDQQKFKYERPLQPTEREHLETDREIIREDSDQLEFPEVPLLVDTLGKSA